MTDLLERLAGAISFMRSKDYANAQATLHHCLTVDPSQCDLWISWVAASGGAVDAAVLDKIVATKNTHRAYLPRLTDEQQEILLNPEHAPHLGLQFAGMRIYLCAPGMVDRAHAASLALNGKFDEANDAIDRLPADWFAAAIRAWMYHRASRFPDVLTATAPLITSQVNDALTYGRLLTGIAHAHLGNFDAARDHLAAVLPTEAVRADADVAAEAAYWIALTFREEGDHQLASQFLQRGLSFLPDSRFQAALNDREVRIRLTRAELIDRRTDRWNVDTEPTVAQVQAEEMAAARGDLLEEGLAELDELIGMDHLKAEIKTHGEYIRGLQLREAAGLHTDKAATHLVFAGPPGTGKTTVAKIVAKIYSGLGLIQTDKLLVTSRSNFVAEYQGQTATRAKKTLEGALDGVLFIDEAYQLVADTGAGAKESFGPEAVTEIVAFMEEHRDRLVVIIAGYSDDIDRLLETNQGWSSRFTTRFDFSSYGIDELVALAELWCSQKEYILPLECVEFLQSKARALLDVEGSTGRKIIDKLGNGRFIRNLMETSAKYAVSKAVSDRIGEDISREELQTLTLPAVQQSFDLLCKRILGGKVA